MNYKDKFYAEYYSTHISHRKGETTLGEFKLRSVYFQRRWARFFPKEKDANIIDIGCGNGSLVWWLQRSGFINAEGIDISPEQIKVAQGLGVNNLYQADLRVFLQAKTCFYDVIVLRDVIEHFEKEEIIEILEICCNALKSGGTMIIQVPNAESPFFGRIRYGDFTHEVAFSSTSLTQLFNMIGMTKTEFYPVEPGITDVKSSIRFMLWKMVEVFYKFLLFAEMGGDNRIVTQAIIVVATKTN